MNLRLQLKYETRSVHERLESRLHLMEDSFSKRDYVNLLLRFYGFYLPFENKILDSRFSALLEDRRKAPALRQDFKALGVAVSEVESMPYAQIEGFGRAEECWGALYVVEGSTLGGQIITRRLSAMFGLSRDDGLTFFSGYGSATARRWEAFLSVMEREHGRCNLDEARTVQSAVSTFEFLEKWLVTQ